MASAGSESALSQSLAPSSCRKCVSGAHHFARPGYEAPEHLQLSSNRRYKPGRAQAQGTLKIGRNLPVCLIC